jgi:hypothetical protein
MVVEIIKLSALADVHRRLRNRSLGDWWDFPEAYAMIQNKSIGPYHLTYAPLADKEPSALRSPLE